MVDRRNCNFCGNIIEPGTGKMYVKIDGSVFFFDKHKCFVNLVELKRVPRETRWSTLSSSASNWKDKEKKQKPAVARKYVPKDLAARLKKEEQSRFVGEKREKPSVADVEEAPKVDEEPAVEEQDKAQ
jgi:large subunit ribosomal protein L24e